MWDDAAATKVIEVTEFEMAEFIEPTRICALQRRPGNPMFDHSDADSFHRVRAQFGPFRVAAAAKTDHTVDQGEKGHVQWKLYWAITIWLK